MVNNNKYNYLLGWLKILGFKIEIMPTIIIIYIFGFGIVVDRTVLYYGEPKKIRYQISVYLPKYALVVTNKRKFPLDFDGFVFWKWKHIYLLHVVGFECECKPGYIYKEN